VATNTSRGRAGSGREGWRKVERIEKTTRYADKIPKLTEATTVKQRITGIINEFTTGHLYQLLSDAKPQNPYTCFFACGRATLQSTRVDAPRY